MWDQLKYDLSLGSGQSRIYHRVQFILECFVKRTCAHACTHTKSGKKIEKEKRKKLIFKYLLCWSTQQKLSESM